MCVEFHGERFVHSSPSEFNFSSKEKIRCSPLRSHRSVVGPLLRSQTMATLRKLSVLLNFLGLALVRRLVE